MNGNDLLNRYLVWVDKEKENGIKFITSGTPRNNKPFIVAEDYIIGVHGIIVKGLEANNES